MGILAPPSQGIVCIFIWRRIPSEIISKPEPGVVFEHSLLHSKWSIREHSGNIQGTFREHSGSIQGTFREHSGIVQGIFSSRTLRAAAGSQPLSDLVDISTKPAFRVYKWVLGFLLQNLGGGGGISLATIRFGRHQHEPCCPKCHTGVARSHKGVTRGSQRGLETKYPRILRAAAGSHPLPDLIDISTKPAEYLRIFRRILEKGDKINQQRQFIRNHIGNLYIQSQRHKRE
jgi:hypothetical protein